MSIEGGNNHKKESVMKWLDKEVGDGENGIIIYPNLQSFRQIYTKYVKDQLAKQEEEKQQQDNDNSNNNSKGNEQLNQESYLSQLFMKQ